MTSLVDRGGGCEEEHIRRCPPDCLVGQGVRKHFDGSGWFDGKVEFKHGLEGGSTVVYRVVYSDGDQEDLEPGELDAILVASSLQQDLDQEKPSFEEISSSPATVKATKSKKRRRRSSVVAAATAAAAPPCAPATPSNPTETLANAANDLIVACRGGESKKHLMEVLVRMHGACIDADSTSAIGDCDSDCLLSALQVLDCFIKDRGATDVMWLKGIEASLALEAASVALRIIVDESVDRRLVGDELIQSTLTLIRECLTTHIPASMGTLGCGTSGTCGEEIDEEGDDGLDGDAAGNDNTSKQVVGGKSKRRRHNGSTKAASSRDLKKPTGTLCEVLCLWERLTRRVHLDDSLLMALSAACLEVLTVEPSSSVMADLLLGIQLSAVGVVCEIFKASPCYRPAIIDDIVSVFRKLPLGRKHLRSLRMPNSHGGSIMVTAGALLRLIQVTPCRRLVEGPADCYDFVPGISDSSQLLSSGRDISTWFVRRLLSRCSTGEPSGSCFRMALSALVDDLLAVLLLPEWPGAELVLCTLAAELVTLLRDAHHLKQASPACLHNIDVLGRIASRLASLMGDSFATAPCSCLRKQEDLHPAPYHSGNIQEAQQSLKRAPKQVCLLCSSLPEYTLAIKMDELSHTLEEMANKNSGHQGRAGEHKILVREADLTRQLILNSISLHTVTDLWVAEARLALIDNWQSQEEEQESGGALANHWESQKEAVPREEPWSAVVLQDSELQVACKRLLVSGELARGLDAMVSQLLLPLGAESPSARSRAIKAISAVVAADPSFMGREAMPMALSNRFHDEAISVREAVASLVGNYVVQGIKSDCRGADLLEAYLKPLLERLVDKGVSVRKSVVKTLRECLLSQRQHPQAALISSALIERACSNKEEDTIKDLIRQTFMSLWFREGSDWSQVSNLIVEVIMRDARCADWLDELLSDLVGKNDSLQSDCTCLARAAVEVILAQTGSEAASHLVPALKLLNAISRASPTSLVALVSSLYPSLHRAATESTQWDESAVVCVLICGIMERVIPFLGRSADVTVMQAVATDLVKATHRHGALAVSAAISCLNSIAVHITRDNAPLIDLLERCLGYLEKYGQKGCSPSKQVIMRASIIAGCVSRFSEVLLNGTADGYQSAAFDNGNGVLRRVYELLKGIACRLEEDIDVRAKASQGLLMVMMGSQRITLLAQEQGVFENILNPRGGTLLLSQALRSCRELLEVAEDHVQSGVIDSEEGSVAGGVLQLHLGGVLKLQLHAEPRVRSAAVSLVGAMLQQGLVNPMDVVPALVALQGDTKDAAVRGQASQHLVSMDEKGGGDFLRARFADGVLLTYSFQSDLLETVSPLLMRTADESPSSVFGLLYTTCFRPSRHMRRSALHSLVALLLDSKQPLGFTSFVAATLAYLPYEIQEEPLIIIQLIARHSSLHGGACVSFLRRMLEKKGVIISRPGEGAFVDDDEVQVALKNEACRSSSGGCEGRDEDASMMRIQCSRAAMIIISLRLKAYLKRAFSLSDARCQNFTTNEIVKLCDRALPKRSKVRFDSSYLGGFDEPEQQVSIFKNLTELLGGDPADSPSVGVTTTATASKKRRSSLMPPPPPPASSHNLRSSARSRGQ